MTNQDILTLNDLRFKLADAKNRLAAAEYMLDHAKSLVTPVGFFPGSNAEARKAAEQAAYFNDPGVVTAKRAVMALEAEITTLNASIDACETWRRAYEWEIRAGLVRALGGNVIVPAAPTNLPVETAAFDDVAQHTTDKAAFELAQPAQPEPDRDPEETIDDLPF